MPYQLEPLPPPPNPHQYNCGRATATGREDSFQLSVHLAQTGHSYLRSQHGFGILQIPNCWRVGCRCSVSVQLKYFTTMGQLSIGSLHSDVKDRHFIMQRAAYHWTCSKPLEVGSLDSSRAFRSSYLFVLYSQVAQCNCKWSYNCACVYTWSTPGAKMYM